MEKEEIKKASDAIKSQLKEKDPNEGNMVAVKFTFDGEVPIVRRDGVDVEEPIPDQEFKGLPKAWKGKHTEAVGNIAFLIGEAKKVNGRKLPLTREEVINYGIPKKVIKELERFGFVTQRIIKVINDKTGKNTGGRVVIYFTPQGKAYMKNKWEKWEERTSGQDGPVPGDSSG